MTAARPHGLFRQVLGWLLLPLALLWPAAVLFTYIAVGMIADATFDRDLVDMARAVAAEARGSALEGVMVTPALNALRDDPVDRMYAQIATDSGRTLIGDANMPPPPEIAKGDVVRLREGIVEGRLVRIAYQWLPATDSRPALLVQVGEPLQRRGALVRNVTALVMAMITVLVPLIVGFVWLGLWRGLRPLRGLGERIERRAADDLSPLPAAEAPAEIAPLVASLNTQLDRVRHNLEAQRRFVADAAHQLRTPLAGLKAQAESALRGGSLEEARARLAHIEASADRLGRLVTQLLALARADDALAQQPPSEAVELNGLLRAVCSDCAEHALARQVELGFDPASHDVAVRGSPLLLRELFANLVDNAIRYTPAQGEVAVRVESQGAARVLVEDTGAGIAPEDRERVFERFHRVLGTSSPGSGLGLAIVRTIAGLHHADVRAEPRSPGPGTRLVVSFPA